MTARSFDALKIDLLAVVRFELGLQAAHSHLYSGARRGLASRLLLGYFDLTPEELALAQGLERTR